MRPWYTPQQVTAFQSIPAGTARPTAHVGDDYDSQVAAALAASQKEADTGNSGGWVRKEVPLDVVQSEQVRVCLGGGGGVCGVVHCGVVLFMGTCVFCVQGR